MATFDMHPPATPTRSAPPAPAGLASEQLIAALAALFGHAPYPCCALAPGALRVLYANAACCRLLGQQSVVGQPLAELLGADALRPFEAALQQCLSSGEAAALPAAPVAEPVAQATALATLQGASLQPWRSAPGEVQGVLVLGREVAGAQRSLAAEREEQNQFFRMLSHDLRNPIGSAKMGAEAIMRSKEVPDKVLAKARRASLALTRADEMISRFLDLRALHAGAPLPLQREQMVLAEALPGYVAELNAYLQGRVEVDIQAPASGLWDRQYILRALGSLVENAAKYGEPATPIRVTLHAEGEGVRLDVRNQGRLLSQAEQQDILATTPWQRAAQMGRSYGGWGLGLLLARSVAQAHDGRLELASSATETCFSMQFDAA